MVQWLMIILVYDFAIVHLSFGEVTLAVRLLQYKNRNGLTYENRPCDTRLEHDINRDGRCDTGFLFCLVPLPFQNPHNCTLGDHFTGFVGADEIFFVNVEPRHESSSWALAKKKQRSSSFVSLWFQPTIYFRFPYPKTGIGLIVEVFDIDDAHNQTIHDSIDFYGRTLLDLKIDRSIDTAQRQRIYLRSLFGSYTNLTADFSLYCSSNYYGIDCETFCLPDVQRYDCDTQTGQKLCKSGYFGSDCAEDVRTCDDQPCWNNGTCVVYLHSYLCQCSKGFTGRSCETQTSTNDPFQCNRTKCIHGNCSINGKCICDDGWTSENCNQLRNHKQTSCASRPCLHNSTCESLIHLDPSLGYRCHCPSGYTGRNCEVAIVTACERTPCLHGQCLKIDLYTEICICEENWTGIDCSKALPTRSSLSSSFLNLPLFDENSNSITSEPTTEIVEATTQSQLKPKKTTIKANIHDYLTWLSVDSTDDMTLMMTTTTTSSLQQSSPCLSGPCLHNSTCVLQSPETFKCICSPSFIGVFCEIGTNPCESSPCQHQSVCISKTNQDVQCVCRPHYTGKYCENPPPMNSQTKTTSCTRQCQNGGTCSIDRFQQEQCLCHSNYTGLHCENAKNNCTDVSCLVNPCTSNPCLFNGTCYVIDSSMNFTCVCSDSFTGDLCEIPISSDTVSILSRDLNESSDRDVAADLWPLAIIFGYVFSLMLVFIIIWFLWYGLNIRNRSPYRSDIPYGDPSPDYYQPNRLGVSNPLFFSSQDHYPTRILKTFSH